MTTLETLQDILMREHKLSREQLRPDAPLSSLGIDSLGVIELMFQIEDRLGITLPDDNSTNFTTIDDVVRYIDKAPVPEPAGKGSDSAPTHSVA
jgi:acyl carrier protein